MIYRSRRTLPRMMKASLLCNSLVAKGSSCTMEDIRVSPANRNSILAILSSVPGPFEQTLQRKIIMRNTHTQRERERERERERVYLFNIAKMRKIGDI